MLYPKLTVDELRPASRLGDEYEAEVSQFQRLAYNILILHRFHNNQKGVLVDKLRHAFIRKNAKPQEIRAANRKYLLKLAC
jgi:hypothetical protein